MTGSELRAALGALGWSKGQLALLLGCDRALVRQWETGRARVPVPVGRWLARAVRGLRAAGPPPVDWRVRPTLSVSGDDELIPRTGEAASWPAGSMRELEDGRVYIATTDGMWRLIAGRSVPGGEVMGEHLDGGEGVAEEDVAENEAASASGDDGIHP